MIKIKFFCLLYSCKRKDIIKLINFFGMIDFRKIILIKINCLNYLILSIRILNGELVEEICRISILFRNILEKRICSFNTAIE